MNQNIVLATFLVFAACAVNVFLLEIMVKFSSASGFLITFSQFLFLTLYGFVTVARFGTKSPVVPIREYAYAVFLFYGSSLASNVALACHIEMPIQMISKSGSVLASLVLGVVLLRRRYTLTKYVSVVMITIGIAMCLLVNTESKDSQNLEKSNFLVWLFGVFLLICSLFMGARLGVCQEEISLKYGKHPAEMSFYLHVLSMPGFLFFYDRIYEQVQRFNQSEVSTIPYLETTVPVVWMYLILNVILQVACVRSVHHLATEMSALSITVVLTLRKFLSLIVSIFYFRNPFTVYHWFGSFFVFFGTLLFTGVLQSIASAVWSRDEKLAKKED